MFGVHFCPPEQNAKGVRSILFVLGEAEPVPGVVFEERLDAVRPFSGRRHKLDASRGELFIGGLAIVRVEQLYPLRLEQLQSALSAYHAEVPVIWVQEEPENMGAWSYMLTRFGLKLNRPFAGIYRPESASPATGSATSHKNEQIELIEAAFK